MSKRAESAALKAYPVEMTPLVYQDLIDQFGGKTEIDVNTYPRCLFQQGYEQAEKDRTLAVEDIKAILDISFWNDDPQKILEEYNRICDTSKVTRR